MNLFEEFFGCDLFLVLPEVAVDGDGIHTSRHGLGGDFAELFLIRAVFVKVLDHFGRDGLGPDAS